MAATTQQPTTWPQLAEGFYSFLTGRGATIEYEMENVEVMAPRDTGADSPQARWNLNGTLRIRTFEDNDSGK
jgi:hypothetical protein